MGWDGIGLKPLPVLGWAAGVMDGTGGAMDGMAKAGLAWHGMSMQVHLHYVLTCH